LINEGGNKSVFHTLKRNKKWYEKEEARIILKVDSETGVLFSDNKPTLRNTIRQNYNVDVENVHIFDPDTKEFIIAQLSLLFENESRAKTFVNEISKLFI